MLDQLREGDVIVVWKLDRLARSTRDLLETMETIRDGGARFQSLSEPWADTTTHAGKMIMTVFAGTLPARSTALLDKYKTEPRTVLNHLHLYGTERLVYRKLRREKDLDISIAAEQTWNEAAVLKRAREIVAIEGAEAFVREFRNPRR
jgi:hypothetical protein